jgi:N6-adenosine-specific RNA methylase IME4
VADVNQAEHDAWGHPDSREWPKKYRTIVADPPWPYSGEIPLGLTKGGRRERGHLGQYPYMALDEIAALCPPAETDAHLYLWTTNAFMVQAHDVARSWGFRPVTICTWVKTHHGDATRVSMKTGYYFRGSTEHFLFCVRGSLRLATTDGLPTAYLWPRTPHSVKPEAFYDLVEQASPGPYLECFARRNRLGWDTWGNESLEHVERDETLRSL